MSVDIEAVTAGDPEDAVVARGSYMVTILFAATSLIGASLLFVVQPLIARLILPYFGGSATVWSTSSLFFQVVLLLGYAYVHLTTRRLGLAQPLLHFAVLLLPLAALPILLPADVAPASDVSPVLWLLLVLAMTIGLPFAVISTTGPLLQRWYSWTTVRRSHDPYFLFATSNLGSFGGLLAYPFVIEPFLTLDEQRMVWSWSFALFVVLMLSCGLTTLYAQRTRSNRPKPVPEGAPPPTSRTVLRWLLLAFLPSSLMLGITAHISTDVAAIPLMWVVPLAIYLATFVVAFARSTRQIGPRITRTAVVMAGVAAFAFLASATLPIGLLLGTDLVLLAVAGFAAHSQLAASRPPAEHLTRFYLIVAGGGALGGVLNGMIAPLLFNSVWEYPLILVIVVLLGGRESRPPWRVVRLRYHPAFVVTLEAAVFTTLGLLVLVLGAAATDGWVHILVTLLLWLGVSSLGSRRPIPFGIALAVVTLLVPLLVSDSVLHRERTFYGAYRVTEADGSRQFSHGTTIHGSQRQGAEASEPTTYYARSGPVGSIFESDAVQDDVGVVGLGVGSMAAYGRPGQVMTFFEIDPAVVDVATDPDLFTYMASSAANIEVVIGDGRLRLAEVPSGKFDLLFVDAFTSDAIPMHLLTLEAFETYAHAVDTSGIIMVHISNRVFDLEPVVAGAAEHLGWEMLVGEGPSDSFATGSVWVALARDPALLEEIGSESLWRQPGPGRLEWTDDFASVLTVLR